jgi:hypothetical protein
MPDDGIEGNSGIGGDLAGKCRMRSKAEDLAVASNETSLLQLPNNLWHQVGVLPLL